MQARRAARELALILFSQFDKEITRYSRKDFEDIMLKSVRILSNSASEELNLTVGSLIDIKEALDTYEAEHESNLSRPMGAKNKPVQIPMTDEMIAKVDTMLDVAEKALLALEIAEFTTLENQLKLHHIFHCGQNKIKPSQVKEFLENEFLEILNKTGSSEISYKDGELNIYFITGVNGAGKTTLIGKMAYRFKEQGKRVLIAAGDTFRAAAEEQVDIWSKRSGADIVRRDKADPASVVYEAIQKARNEKYDVILVDTAGRLQNKFNLMEELSKIKGVIDKNAPNELRESFLVIDANTGQNGLQQAKVFKECVNLTAVALTKLDGSAKGAIVLAIAKELGLPVKLVGVGEKMEIGRASCRERV